MELVKWVGYRRESSHGRLLGREVLGSWQEEELAEPWGCSCPRAWLRQGPLQHSLSLQISSTTLLSCLPNPRDFSSEGEAGKSCS